MSLHVIHDGLRIGTLGRDGRNFVFEASDEWRAKGPELSPILPLCKAGPQQCNLPDMLGLHGLFYNSLPDTWGTRIMEDEFSARGLASPDALDRLAYVGRYGMGSLVFEPGHPGFDREALGVFDIMDSARNARHIEAHGGDVAALRKQFGGNNTAGGARPKINVRRRTDGTFATEVSADITGESGEACILKFEGTARIERVEFALMRMAAAAGLNVAAAEQIVQHDDEGEFRHILVRRFDRQGERERFHCATLYALTHGTYRSVSHADYLDLADAARAVGAEAAIPEIILRGVFGRVVGNLDDHHKNHSFLFRDGVWSLAPAYDITHTPQGAHAMRFAGQTEPNALDTPLVKAFADLYGVPHGPILDGLERIAAGVAAWEEFASGAGVEPDRVRSIGDGMKKRLACVLSGDSARMPSAPKRRVRRA